MPSCTAAAIEPVTAFSETSNIFYVYQRDVPKHQVITQVAIDTRYLRRIRRVQASNALKLH